MQMQSEMNEQPMMGKSDQPGGYEICIRVDAQGALSVGVEGQEPQGEGAMMGAAGDAAYQPAGSIKEALSAALAIYKSNGKVDIGAEEQTGFDSAMGQPQ